MSKHAAADRAARDTAQAWVACSLGLRSRMGCGLASDVPLASVVLELALAW
jgi:hypothetical protein